MNIRFTNERDTPERLALIKQVLPKETIIETILEPSIEERLFDILAQCVRKELDIYRAYPKNTALGKEEPLKKSVETFDPTNNETCFMGKGFRSNATATDYELTKYRKAIGTIPHVMWGDCTLLEIWGADHFELHTEMVRDAFRYGMNMIKKCPEIKFHVNPLFKNKKSRELRLNPAQQQYKDEMDMLLAKAMIFGVNEPKTKRKR